MIGVVQSVGVGEVRRIHAELRRLLVHHVHEVFHALPPVVPRQKLGGVTEGIEHHPREKILHGEGLPLADVHVNGAVLDDGGEERDVRRRDGGGARIRAVIQHHQGGEDLGGGGGVHPHPGVLFIQNGIRLRIPQVNPLAVQRQVVNGIPGGVGRAREGRQTRQNEKKSREAA